MSHRNFFYSLISTQLSLRFSICDTLVLHTNTPSAKRVRKCSSSSFSWSSHYMQISFASHNTKKYGRERRKELSTQQQPSIYLNRNTNFLSGAAVAVREAYLSCLVLFPVTKTTSHFTHEPTTPLTFSKHNKA